MIGASPERLRGTGWPDVLIRPLIVGILGLAIWAALQPWGLRWDFASVYDAGHRVLVGEADRLYEATSPIDGQPALGVMRFWSTPLAGALYAPLAVLSPRAALRVFKLQNVVAYGLGLSLLVIGYLRHVSTADATAQAGEVLMFLGLCVIFQPFWSVFLVGGQTTPTVFLLLVLFLIAFVKGSDRWAAALLSGVLLIKPAFVVMTVVFVMAGRRRFLAWLMACLAAAGLCSLVMFGWQPNIAFLRHVSHGLGATRLWQFNSSLPTVVENFRQLWPDQRVPPGWLTALGVAVVLLRGSIVALFVWLWRRGGATPMEEEGRRNHVALLSMLFFLLFSDIIWEHYLAVLFIPATFVLARRRHFGREAITLVLAAVALCAGQNVFVSLTLDEWWQVDTILEVLVVGLFKSGPLMLMLLFLARHHDELARASASVTLGPLRVVRGSAPATA